MPPKKKKIKKLKDFKRVERKVIELKNWRKSPTYKSKYSDEILHYTYFADLYINGVKKLRFSVKADSKDIALKRFLDESKKPNPRSALWE